MGVGYDTIDLEACGRRGVVAANVPDYGTTDVGDHAIAMLLSLARGIATYDRVLRRDLAAAWRYDVNPTARRLRELTCGVIGLGAIGTAAALRAKAFGMQVRFFDPYILPGRDIALAVERAATLEALLSTCDVVTIHAPLTDETRKMIDARAVAAMRPGTLLVNAARGPIVDTAGPIRAHGTPPQGAASRKVGTVRPSGGGQRHRGRDGDSSVKDTLPKCRPQRLRPCGRHSEEWTEERPADLERLVQRQLIPRPLGALIGSPLAEMLDTAEECDRRAA
jgi:hypothetical protein